MSSTVHDLRAQCMLLGFASGGEGDAESTDRLERTVRLLLHEHQVPVTTPSKLLDPVRTRDSLRAEVARASFVIAEISDPTPADGVYLGLAHNLDKPLVTLRRFDAEAGLPFERLSQMPIVYEATDNGALDVRKTLGAALDGILRTIARDVDAFVAEDTDVAVPWARLSPTGYENLCLDLLLRDGIETPRWLDDTREVDLVATRPRGDGTSDLCLVAIGSGLDAFAVDGWMHDLPVVEAAIQRLAAWRPLAPTTERLVIELIVFWSRDSGDPLTIEREAAEAIGRGIAESLRGRPLTLRTQRFDRERLEGMIREEPLILRQHFFHDAFRGGPDRRLETDSLYRDTARVARRAVDIADRLEELYGKDPGRRWQEKAYSLTHSIGNAIFPIETYLDFLHERFTDEGSPTGRELAELMEHCLGCIHKAKVHIQKFKKIARFEEPTLEAVDLLPRIERSLDIAVREGVRVEFHPATHGLFAYADLDEVDELLDELVRNSLYWLGQSDDPLISVRVQKADPESLPGEILHRDDDFLWIRYRDSGPGVADERKERIFELSYSTNPQGMGYGLALVRNNLRRFGGAVAETGLEGHGAQFDLYLPVAGPEALLGRDGGRYT